MEWTDYRWIRTILKVSATVSILPVIGCAISNPYPSTWSQVKQSASIASQLEGTYRCYGVIDTDNTAGEQSKESPADFLISSNTSMRCKYITIRLTRPDEIEVSIYRTDLPVRELVFREGKDYRIEGDWLVLRSTGFFSASEYGLGYTSVKTSISLSAEDDLIMKARNRSVGLLLFVIPLGVTGTDWGIFGRIHEN